jgi:8-oxo-dGTP pyrophosphatase MutT (NUDIX family)
MAARKRDATFIVQFNAIGEVLLLKRPPDHPKSPNQWTLPGGKRDWDDDEWKLKNKIVYIESIDACASREFEEETGARLSVFRMEPILSTSSKHIIYTYTSIVDLPSDILPKEFPNNEHVEYMWWNAELDDAPEGMSQLALDVLTAIADLYDDEEEDD